jgi:hypothetical protein
VSALTAELQQRWQSMFSQLAAGGELAPGPRLRAEGMMEATVLSGQASESELQQAMDEVYLACFGRSLVEDFGTDWTDFYPFPQIPAVTKRAPVFPSTRD